MVLIKFFDTCLIWPSLYLSRKDLCSAAMKGIRDADDGRLCGADVRLNSRTALLAL